MSEEDVAYLVGGGPNAPHPPPPPVSPSQIERFYHPKLPDAKPGYQVAPLTDSWAFRLVKRHGRQYPVFSGFFSALLRFRYGVEGVVLPYEDRVFGDGEGYPIREYDVGQSAYDFEEMVPWPLRPKVVRPCWHPWYRAPPHTEERLIKTKNRETGEVTEKKETVRVKGALNLFVLHKGSVEVPALSLGSYRVMVDYAHHYGGLGEMAALRDVALERAIRAEGAIAIEGSRLAMKSYDEKFRDEAEEGTEQPTVAGGILATLDKLKKMAEEGSHD
jgi:hypothetical protein